MNLIMATPAGKLQVEVTNQQTTHARPSGGSFHHALPGQGPPVQAQGFELGGRCASDRAAGVRAWDKILLDDWRLGTPRPE